MKDRFEELDGLDLEYDESQGVLAKTLRNVGIIAIVCVVVALLIGTNSGDDDKVGQIAPEAEKRSVAADNTSRSDAVLNQAALAAAIPADNGISTEMTIRSGANGHFQVTAEIDGTAVPFIVDTGASRIILTRQDAESIGLFVGPQDFTQRYQTANGIAKAAPVVLSSIRIGDLEMYDLQASVMEKGLSVSLLGMSFLSRLEGYKVRGDRLVIAYR